MNFHGNKSPFHFILSYYFVPLDIFRKNIQNKGIQTKLDAWLTFLTSDEPVMIMELIQAFPEFKPLYEDIYELCRNVEGVMNMFSKELRELDRNTVQCMIDLMQEEINKTLYPKRCQNPSRILAPFLSLLIEINLCCPLFRNGNCKTFLSKFCSIHHKC